jgi:hypothetical protein
VGAPLLQPHFTGAQLAKTADPSPTRRGVAGRIHPCRITSSCPQVQPACLNKWLQIYISADSSECSIPYPNPTPPAAQEVGVHRAPSVKSAGTLTGHMGGSRESRCPPLPHLPHVDTAPSRAYVATTLSPPPFLRWGEVSSGVSFWWIPLFTNSPPRKEKRETVAQC